MEIRYEISYYRMGEQIMTQEEKMKFLHLVRKTVATEPELVGEISQMITAGVADKLSELKEQASDMETIAMAFSSMASQRYSKSNEKWAQGIIKSKLEKHKDTSFLNWEIEE